jgi:hypothetical protein
MAAAGSVEKGVTHGARRVLGRGPTARELKILSTALTRYQKIFQSDTEKAQQLLTAAGAQDSGDPNQTAWMLVASTLLNMDEAVTRQ